MTRGGTSCSGPSGEERETYGVCLGGACLSWGQWHGPTFLGSIARNSQALLPLFQGSRGLAASACVYGKWRTSGGRRVAKPPHAPSHQKGMKKPRKSQGSGV